MRDRRVTDATVTAAAAERWRLARPHSASRGHTSTRRQFSQRVPIQPTGQVSTASETTPPVAQGRPGLG